MSSADFTNCSSLSGSVTRWIPGLKCGDQKAQAWLLARYFRRIVDQASERLGNAPRRARDEEDVASEVFQQFLERAQTDGFRQLQDRTDLESILLMLTQRRATDLFRSATARQKFEVGESACGYANGNQWSRPLDSQPSAAPAGSDDSLTHELTDSIRDLFRSIECDELKLEEIATLRLQGLTVDEIAEQVGELKRTVYRRLALIRNRWQESMDGETANLKRA